MAKEPIDQQLKKSLLKGTEHSGSLKDDIWNQIEKRIQEEAPVKEHAPRRYTEPKPKKQWGRISFISSIAAAIIMVLLATTTETGMALVSQMKEWFVPEKTIEIELEGMKEDSNVTVHEGTSNYVIYFDEERYKLIQVEGNDRIVLKEELDERYPEVYMEISQVKQSPDKVIQVLQNRLKEEGMIEIPDAKEVEEPVNGWMVYGIGGSGGTEWDDPMIRYYVFDNGQNGSFIVKQKFFLEAEEGHGVRFDQIVKELHIVEDVES
ncbi:hypothetical protein ACFSCX_16725 [Bacillus salitolerans]|uniref:DUF4367 domain-containing protein n=1 Tax=Bacillus salitolerans TaxID=1437434 RepID=A0ABW4LU48_9BACI